MNPFQEDQCTQWLRGRAANPGRRTYRSKAVRNPRRDRPARSGDGGLSFADGTTARWRQYRKRRRPGNTSPGV